MTITWIWKSKCIPKIKFFAWLLLNDKLNTRNMLRGRNKFLEDGYNCPLCLNDLEETMEHLFFDCPSATNRWFALGIQWNENSNIHHKILLAEQQFNLPFFMEIFMIGARAIWNERNDYVFNHKPPSCASWKARFKSEVRDHLVKIKKVMTQVDQGLTRVNAFDLVDSVISTNMLIKNLGRHSLPPLQIISSRDSKIQGQGRG
jgi:hypothetical protein